jgi:hypothetical protein
MKFITRVIVSTLVLTALSMGVINSNSQAAEEYSFSVYNSTDTAIKEILVSEDQVNWGRFDIG